MSHDQPLPDPRLRSVEPKSLLYILTLSSTSHKNLAPVCYSFETRPEMVNAGDAAKPDVDASLFPFRIFIPLLLFFHTATSLRWSCSVVIVIVVFAKNRMEVGRRDVAIETGKKMAWVRQRKMDRSGRCKLDLCVVPIAEVDLSSLAFLMLALQSDPKLGLRFGYGRE